MTVGSCSTPGPEGSRGAWAGLPGRSGWGDAATPSAAAGSGAEY